LLNFFRPDVDVSVKVRPFGSLRIFGMPFAARQDSGQFLSVKEKRWHIDCNNE
jgi:hypothetical protein